ncbi:MAG: GntR family transcriptional regulator [Kiloniellales bacterium]|nr:GntR family transcriptional regulator [Kiloniellales bacterium]
MNSDSAEGHSSIADPQKQPTAAGVDPGSSTSLTEKAYLRIEHMIVTAELAPGSWISEAAISQQIGIGRTPVREALQRLSSEHLINIVPRRGIFVTEINVQHQLLLLEVRGGIERLMAVRAARYRTTRERQRMLDLAEAMVRAAEAGEYKESIRFGRDCSLFIRQCSRNPYAERAVAPLYSASRRFFYLYAQPEDVVRSASYHAALMQAAARGDTEAAAQAADALMEFLESFARAVIDHARPPTTGTIDDLS